MTNEFTARAASFENDGYATVLSFADKDPQPTAYLILQIVNSPSAEDIRLGHDGVYLEVGGEEEEGYNLVRTISMTGNVVEISLSDAAAATGLSNKYILHLAVAEGLRVRIAAAVENFSKRL